MGLGSGDNGEFTFLDCISIMGFLVGLQNLDLNITQEDFQDASRRIDARLEYVLSEIHEHLEEQDEKINRILEVLANDSRRSV